MNTHLIRVTFTRYRAILAQRLLRRVERIARRAVNPFATHVPILVGIGSRLPVRRVLELGCGDYSTGTFLNKEAFPELELLVSHEDDRDWAFRVAEQRAEDHRFQLKYVGTSMVDSISRIDTNEYDLVFVDNGTKWQSRAAVLNELAKTCCRPLVLIHDYEVQPYREAALLFRRRFVFRSFTPQTGVAWSNPSRNIPVFKEIDRVLARHASGIPPHDIAEWLHAFRGPRF